MHIHVTPSMPSTPKTKTKTKSDRCTKLLLGRVGTLAFPFPECFRRARCTLQSFTQHGNEARSVVVVSSREMFGAHGPTSRWRRRKSSCVFARLCASSCEWSINEQG